MAHGSDSATQAEVEAIIRSELSRQTGWALEPADLEFDGIKVSLDGIDRARKIAVEIYSRIGKRSASRDHKIVSDAAKLHLARKHLGADFRLVLALCDAKLGSYYDRSSKKWQARLLQELGVEVQVVLLAEDQQRKLMATQAAQAIANVKAPAKA